MILPMSTVPEQLREAREKRNLTVQQVAEITKIRADHVVSLEEGDYKVFSAPVYIRGFVRTYSGLLKLNTAQVLMELDEELKQTDKFSEPPPLTQGGGFIDRIMLALTRIDWRRSGLLILGVGLLATVMVVYSVVQHRRKHDPLSNLKPVLYDAPTQAVSGEVLPLPGSPPRK